MSIDFQIGLFAPAAMFAQFPTMVAPENNNGVLIELEIAERL
jgi:hypothetical protein